MEFLTPIVDYVTHAGREAWALLRYVFTIYCVVLAIEFLYPAEREQPLRDIGFNILYTALYVMLITLVVPLFQKITAPWLASDFAGWMEIAFPDTLIGQIGQGLAFFFIFDFFYYWLHRAQHTFGWFWAQHQLHHAEPSVNITTSNRHHWLEEPIRVFVIFLPMGLLFNLQPVSIAAVWSTLLLWGYFIHTNVRLQLGPLTPVIAGPQWHRLHHSTLPQHRDKNFAAFFPIWDVVFGTYVKPERNEFPRTGIDSGDSMNRVGTALFSPFTDWWKMSRGQPSSAHDKPKPREEAV